MRPIKPPALVAHIGFQWEQWAQRTRQPDAIHQHVPHSQLTLRKLDSLAILLPFLAVALLIPVVSLLGGNHLAVINRIEGQLSAHGLNFGHVMQALVAVSLLSTLALYMGQFASRRRMARTIPVTARPAPCVFRRGHAEVLKLEIPAFVAPLDIALQLHAFLRACELVDTGKTDSDDDPIFKTSILWETPLQVRALPARGQTLQWDITLPTHCPPTQYAGVMTPSSLWALGVVVTQGSRPVYSGSMEIIAL